ncbi:MAG: LysR family transcriptional regulator [Pseudobdellovibrio sp.]|jgi:DNA-binding transcriptional LysR family regulator|nr:LysR family transcriptional regulator [Pseudobdellovibrio sp.]
MEIELVQIFVKVVKAGSFTKAAELMRIPKSSVSKAITRLEAESGTKLLLRTTRSQTLTAAGKVFYDTCVGPVQTIEDAQKSLSGSDSLLTGNLKITAPEDLGTQVLAPASGCLTRKHPGLSFELNYTNQIVDLVKEGYDLAVRIGPLRESGLKSKKVGEVKLILVASPAYLKSSSKISKPDDIKSHPCLSLTSGPWNLRSTTGASAQVPITVRIRSNQMSSLLKASASGAGIALVPAFLAKPLLDSGDLSRVLPQWASHGVQVNMLSPLNFSSSARLRMATDYFMVELQKALSL